MKKLTYEFIKEQFENEGYELLSAEYTNQREKLGYICPEGHRHSINWSDWKQNRRCPYCGLRSRASKRRLNFDIIQKSFENERYILLTNKFDYRNVDQKLDFICSNGHKYFMNYHNWKSGWRCTYCHHEKLSLLFTGDGHPGWKGGISCELYCDAWADKEYKESIKERDGYECQNPDCWGKDSCLAIHHVDYNKKNCTPWNLITICRSCNARANFERSKHEEIYKNILRNKYDYKEA